MHRTFGYGLDTWNNLLLVGLGIVALGGGIVALGGFFIFFTNRIVIDLQKQEANDLQRDLSSASITAEGANKEAAKANERAAELTKEAELLKNKNLKLQQLAAPRRLFLSVTKDKFNVITDLDKSKGTTVIIQAVPDWEAYKLAGDIYEILAGHGWIAKKGLPAETTFSPQEIFDGVSVHVRNKVTLAPSDINLGIAAGRAVTAWIDATGEILVELPFLEICLHLVMAVYIRSIGRSVLF